MRVDEVRARSARRMVVEFEDDVDAAGVVADGVELVARDGRRLTLRVAGPIDALLGRLARHRIRYLAFPESNIEEAFASYYTSTQGGAE
jgi:hypothetical protein